MEEHDDITAKRIHSLTYRVIEDLQLKILRTPRLLNTDNPNDYSSSTFDIQKPIVLGDRHNSYPISDLFAAKIANELATLWIALWEKGFAAYDFKLYLQPDNTVIFRYYYHFGFRMTSGPRSIELPGRFQDPETGTYHPILRYFFDQACFPQNFVSLLLAKGCEPPADCLRP